MTEQIKVTCHRCLGSGKYSFNLKDGDMCYGCKGSGYVYTTQAKLNAAAKCREIAKQKAIVDKAKAEEHASMVRVKLILIRKIYKNDSRMATLINIPEQYHYMHYLEWAAKDGIA